MTHDRLVQELSTSSGFKTPAKDSRDGGAHHFHQHRAIADEVSPPEGCWDPLARHGIPVAVFFSDGGMPILVGLCV